MLEETKKNEDGDYIIPRDVRKISSITMHGTIECENGSANWYSAGGGLMFDVETDSGKKLVYQEYAFNKDTTNISIDFGSYENIKYDGNPIEITEEQIVGDYFLVSIIWWKTSSDMYHGTDSDISLTVDSIEIHYKEPVPGGSSSRHIVTHSTFSDVFENNIPSVLENTTAFYLVTDHQDQLLSINSGNMIHDIEDSNAESYIGQITKSGRKNGKLKIDNSAYSYSVKSTDDVSIIVFVNNSFTNIASRNLLLISVLVGIAVLILMVCDENKISQLVGILIDNALKYSDEKSDIHFSMQKNRDSVVITCSNPCSDFSVADTSMLFERFYRSDNDQRNQQEGFGLGLSIAQAITELHNGKIEADYFDGSVRFITTLPLE